MLRTYVSALTYVSLHNTFLNRQVPFDGFRIDVARRMEVSVLFIEGPIPGVRLRQVSLMS